MSEHLDDARSTDPVERLLEDSWQSRSQPTDRREFFVEAVAGAAFLCFAVPLAAHAIAHHPVDWRLAAMLVVLYALGSRVITFPIGAGYVVPSYLVLVPMLLLLPPGLVPLLTAGGIVLGTLGQVAARHEEPKRIVCSVPDAWHAVGPAVVLMLAGHLHGNLETGLIYLAAFAAGCAVDLLSAVLREAAIMGIASLVQIRVIAVVWVVDACVAPLGLLVAHAGRHSSGDVLLLLPLNALMLMMSRDRNARIDQAQRRLDLVARERARLQRAVRRLGDALAAKLDLDALTDIVLRGSIEALDADAGRLVLSSPVEPKIIELDANPSLAPALRDAAAEASASGVSCQLERDGVWALALPFSFPAGNGRARGALAVVREQRSFRADEEEVMRGLVDRAQEAAAGIVAHQALREQAYTDALTKLGNRRKLTADMDDRLAGASATSPLVLIAFDLDGFKSYNDTFGHQAGDALLARLGAKLAAAVAGHGGAYRLGGDEFCVLLNARSADLGMLVAMAAGALEEGGENFAVHASYGAVVLPHEAANLDYAMQLADERMYSRKRERPSLAGDQARDVLLGIINAKQPALQAHSSEVARLSRGVGARLGMTPEALKELDRAAELHDIGKVGIPDQILEKPGELTEAEWGFMRQHTILGERILSAAPALRSVALIVRSTHERWDGNGYPDRLAGDTIPVAARIIAACDAYIAMTGERCYGPRMDHRAACAELRRCAGDQFDPVVVATLLDELEGASTAMADPRMLVQAAIEAPQGGARLEGSHLPGAVQSADEVAAYLREALARPIAASPELEVR